MQESSAFYLDGAFPQCRTLIRSDNLATYENGTDFVYMANTVVQLRLQTPLAQKYPMFFLFFFVCPSSLVLTVSPLARLDVRNVTSRHEGRFVVVS